MPKFFQALMLVLAVVVLAACGNVNRQPRYNMDAEYQIQSFKRFAKWDGKSVWHRPKTKAYTKLDTPITRRISETQREVLERHGQPEYIRKHWKASTGEIVDEWAWWDRKVVCQFVQRELVWEGPLTDMDQYRIRYGTPMEALEQQYEAGVRRDIWTYQGILNATDGKLVTFSDERLVSVQNF